MIASLILALVLAVPSGSVYARAADMASEPRGAGPTTPEDEPDGDSDDEAIAPLRAEIEALRADVEALRGLLTDLSGHAATPRPALSTVRLPGAIVFGGGPVPLDRWDVAERLEREFYLALAQPAQVILWLKRSARYFPYIEERLRTAGLPDDLKYVAVVESSLLPSAYSWAHASGIWQFIADTARRYGLRVTASWDERRDPERSTSAALAYLRDLHAKFGDWPLALAGYNAGESRVETALKTQAVSTYYQLALAAETERYVFRVLAAKLILDEPARYGFRVPPEERYAPHATDVVTVPVAGFLRVQEIAAAAGSFYREIKALNPAIMRDRLPEGRYDVRIPSGGNARFAAKLPDVRRVMAARAVRRVEYRVKSGDTLQAIARRFGVSVDALRKWNTAARRAHIYPGDQLIIEEVGRTAAD